MTDQISPTGSLALSLSPALTVAAAPRPAPEKTSPVKLADTQPQGQGTRSAAESAKTSETAMNQLNSHLQQAGSELKFQVDEGSGRTFFQIVSESTGKVVLQVPSEEMLAMARKLRALEKQTGASGVLVDKEG